MKAHLMYRDGDFALEKALPANAEALIQDLGLDTLFTAMAARDEFLFKVARHALLLAQREERDTILYRQAILNDTFKNYSIVKSIYDLAVEALENKNKGWYSIFAHFAGSILSSGVELMQMSLTVLEKLRGVAEEHAEKFESEGFKTFFAMLKTELTDEYLDKIKNCLRTLKFRHGVLLSAQLGKANKGTNYILRESTDEKPWWMEWIVGSKQPSYSFRLAERDEAGAKALSEMHDRGINEVANAAMQSSDHVMSFFLMLRTELAFYLGCANLRQRLSERKVPCSVETMADAVAATPTSPRNSRSHPERDEASRPPSRHLFYKAKLPMCLPVPMPAGSHQYKYAGLRDVSLVLNADKPVVGNDLDAVGRKAVIITGANQGGKSTFLRSVGVAQLMMQSGMFVAAESFSADVCCNLFTHYKREEDSTMTSGKLDEELSRVSEIADALTPNALLLFNESFAATNEREGSEIARQIVHALLETRAKVFFVTHLYEFAHSLWAQKPDSTLFLRAERQADGQRTFKLHPGEPLQTSYGVDLYDRIFKNENKPREEQLQTIMATSKA